MLIRFLIIIGFFCGHGSLFGSHGNPCNDSKTPIIIFLNGTSSAGKSTLALELQKVLPPSLHVGIDHFFVMLPPDYVFGGSHALEGIYLEFEDDQNTTVKTGPVGKQLAYAMHRSIKALHDSQFNLIIDELLFDKDTFKDYLELFHDCTVYFIAVKPPLEVVQQREQMRQDRVPGMAKGLYEATYADKIYDLEIDTSLLTPQESTKKIIDYIEANPNPQAFNQNYDHYVGYHTN